KKSALFFSVSICRQFVILSHLSFVVVIPGTVSANSFTVFSTEASTHEVFFQRYFPGAWSLLHGASSLFDHCDDDRQGFFTLLPCRPHPSVISGCLPRGNVLQGFLAGIFRQQ